VVKIEAVSGETLQLAEVEVYGMKTGSYSSLFFDKNQIEV
jgi:hypothetical protein